MADYNFTTYYYPPTSSGKIKLLTGQRFGRLMVLGFAGLKNRRTAMWHCICDCGNGITKGRMELVNGHVQSCKCLALEVRRRVSSTHGHTRNYRATSEYTTFLNARARCTHTSNTRFKDYGGKGIEFRFKSFEEFYEEVGPKPSPQHSLDRYPDQRGHYEPGNVRWATMKEQQRNRTSNRHITAFGRTQVLSEWAEESGIDYSLIQYRLRKGWCSDCSMGISPNMGTCPHRVKPPRKRTNNLREF